MAELIKNMVIYTLPSAPNLAPDDLEERLAHKGNRVLGKLERDAVNSWSKPAGRKSQVFLHDIQGQRLMMMKTQKRMVPPSTVKEMVNDEVAELEEQSGQKVTAKAKRDIKHRIVDELLPNAPIKTSYTPVWWDTVNGRLIIGAASRKVAEGAADLLRETVGSLPAIPLATEMSAMRGMTDWLRDPESRPGWMELGDKAVLTATNQDGRFSGSKLDLGGEEIERMLEAGCNVSQLALRMVDQAAFELTYDLAFKGIKIADTAKEAHSDVETDSDFIAQMEVDFIITHDTLTWMIDQVVTELGGEIDTDLREEEENAA